MKVLRYHVNYLVARGYKGFALVLHQLVNLPLLNFRVGVLPHNVAAGLQAFYVVARNAHVHLGYFKVGVAGGAVGKRRLYAFYGLVNVQHLPVLHAVAVGAPKAKYFQFVVLILAPCNGSNFGCAYVETNNDWCFIKMHVYVF
jgi:hypothetical protein